MNGFPVALALATLGVGFVLGRAGTPAATSPVAGSAVRSIPAQASNDPREVIPLTPGSGQQPGAGPPQPGQGECTVLMFKDGQFYQMQPQPGGQPGTGPGRGTPGGDNELFPLQPAPAPVSPFPGSEERST